MSDPLRDSITNLFVSFSGSGGNLVIPRPYIDFCAGDHLSALLLSQILYWSERARDPAGWFAKSYGDWFSELAMTEYQVKRALHGDKRRDANFKGLCSIGVETKLKPSAFYNGAPVLHYRVDRAVLQKAVHKFVQNDVPATTHNQLSSECTTQNASPETAPQSVPDTKHNELSSEPNLVQNAVLNLVQDQYTETISTETIEQKEKEKERSTETLPMPSNPVEAKQLAQQLFDSAIEKTNGNRPHGPKSDAEIQAEIARMYAKHPPNGAKP